MNRIDRRNQDRELSPALEAFFALFLASILVFLFFIRSSTDILLYPWLFPDSFDWLWNAQAYSLDSSHLISHRGMFFTLIGSYLFRFGLENLLSLFGTLGLLFLGLANFFGVKGIFGRNVAIISTVFLFFSSNIIGQSAYVGCDVMSTAFVCGFMYTYFQFLKTERLKFLLGAGVLFALGLHVQYIGVILFPFLLICFFISWESGSRIWTFRRVSHFAKNLIPYGKTIFISLGFAFALLLPRWLSYHVLYEQKVMHGALVEFCWNLQFYLAGMLSVFSWPILLSAGVGVSALLASSVTRRPAFFLLGWVGTVFLFFSFLYKFPDIRLLIYLAPPIFVFAAAGTLAISRIIRLPIGLCVLLLGLAAHIRTAPAWYSNIFYLFPNVSFEYSPEHGLKKDVNPLRIPILEELEFSKKWQERTILEDIESVRYSEPLRRLLPRIRKEAVARNIPIVVFDRQPLHELYILRTRNHLYTQRPVSTVESFSQVLLLARTSPVMLVIKHDDIPSFRQFLGRSKLLSQGLLHEAGWLGGVFVHPNKKNCVKEFSGDALVLPACEKLVETAIICSELNLRQGRFGSPLVDCMTSLLIPEPLKPGYQAIRKGLEVLTVF